MNDTDRIKELECENSKLRKAARLIARRKEMASGSAEMAYCDEFCKRLGLRPFDRQWYGKDLFCNEGSVKR